MTVILILAVLIDRWLGEPKKFHPLIFFGYLSNRIEKLFRHSHQPSYQQRTHGILACLIMTIPVSIAIFLLDLFIATYSHYLSIIFSAWTLYFCIAAKSLHLHTQPILSALKNNKLELAKRHVAMIVSRETQHMTESEVRKATIESVLENGADAIFAPIFWFIIAGPAGAICYRLCNTLDAMWGYKNQKFIYFGWAAARFDDVLNFIPARLTAITYAALGHCKQAFYCWKHQAHLLDSPNAGPVMTAGAGSLGLTLGGPAWYNGQLTQKISFGLGHEPSNKDIHKANQLVSHSLYLWVFIICLIEITGAYFA